MLKDSTSCLYLFNKGSIRGIMLKDNTSCLYLFNKGSIKLLKLNIILYNLMKQKYI